MKTNNDGTAVQFALGCAALATSVVALYCFSSVWSYWYLELDADCPNARDCKCLLFGTSFAGGSFVGGEQYVCRYVVYSTLASAGLAACACSYFGTKWLLCPASRDSSARRRPSHGHRLVSRSPPPPPPPSGRPRPPHAVTSPQMTGFKICFVIMLASMALNICIASIVLNYGYYSTCHQYVHRVKSYLMVTGNMVELVSNRMSCSTIYDFLDYIQPPSRQVATEFLHRHKTNPRDDIINTSTFLIISTVMSWFSTTIWIIFTFCVYHFK